MSALEKIFRFKWSHPGLDWHSWKNSKAPRNCAGLTAPEAWSEFLRADGRRSTAAAEKSRSFTPPAMKAVSLRLQLITSN